MMTSKFTMFAAGIAALTTVPAVAAPNLVKNGGFENVTRNSGVTGNFEFGSTPKAAGQVDNWTSASTSSYNILFNSATANTSSAAGTFAQYGNEYLWASTASSQGGNFVALDGDSDYRGALTQMITNLVTGNYYTLSFEWGAAQLHSRSGDTTEQLQYSLGGDTFLTSVLSNPSHGFTGWQTVTRTFRATSTSELLSFLSIGTPNGLPPMALLDNVSLSAVPEPASWAMMIAGFGLVGAAMRVRRRQSLPLLG